MKSNESDFPPIMRYDYMGRRGGKLHFNSQGTWTSTVKFFYKDYTLIEKSSASNDVLKEFVWDPTAGSATRPLFLRLPGQAVSLLYCHDANKNVTEVSYLATANGIGAHYEYDSFGNTITSSSNTRVTTVDVRAYNPFQFSSEYHDDELDLIYYNYRHYNPQSGRWINRDPIAERGGINLYNFVLNNALNQFDVLGLSISVAGRNVGTPWGLTGSNHTFIVIKPTDLEGLKKCCPNEFGKISITSLKNPDGSTTDGFTMGGFNVGGKLTYQSNEDNDLESINEETKWWKPDWDFEETPVEIPERKNENQIICDLLKAANNYNKNKADYFLTTTNCTRWVISIFASLGIKVDPDFGGKDWDGFGTIPAGYFVPTLPKIIPPKTPVQTPLAPRTYPVMF